MHVPGCIAKQLKLSGRRQNSELTMDGTRGKKKAKESWVLTPIQSTKSSILRFKSLELQTHDFLQVHPFFAAQK